MSLYGLDVIIARDGRRFINEINGIRSGMVGFQKIYGDDRVRQRVADELSAKYGDITINDGSYLQKEYLRNHPIIARIQAARDKFPSINRKLRCWMDWSGYEMENPEIDWIKEFEKTSEESDEKPVGEAKKRHDLKLGYDFPIYDGQESTVMNFTNQKLPHPLINSFVNEDITRNKMLQYLLLKDTDISRHLPESAFVGLGITDDKKLEEMLSRHKSFIFKPIMGLTGTGVQFMMADEVKKKYLGSRGPAMVPSNRPGFLTLIGGLAGTLVYVEDWIDKGCFSFEWSIAMLQPFINSSFKRDEREYKSVRAIVCNGKFIDAYARVSKSKIVNLARDAQAKPFEYGSDFAGFCENIVNVFEREAAKLQQEDFKKALYAKYYAERGYTSQDERLADWNARNGVSFLSVGETLVITVHSIGRAYGKLLEIK